MWCKFSDDFNWRPSRRGMRSFKAGQKVNVPLACVEAAEAAGKGKRTSKEDNTSETESEATEVFLTDETEDETPKKQSMFGKLTGTADRDAD
ncbi:hypothetical protein [Henriciella sp.]|uniref:hypothetical protein n=1 Tax=Henriciella sp. TaxID=1968823 RepID=UPI0026215507|nr:hypothetical protein [Henriciella sp.]